jgi:hypothetical protein
LTVMTMLIIMVLCDYDDIDYYYHFNSLLLWFFWSAIYIGKLKNPDKKKILDDLDVEDDDDDGDSYDGEDGDIDGNDENKRLSGGGYDDTNSKKKTVVSKKSKGKASVNDDDELDDIFNQMTSIGKK